MADVLYPDLQWEVVVIDDQSLAGDRREQVMTDPAVVGYDAATSNIHAVSGPKAKPSSLRLTFLTATPNLSIREMMEVHLGWRDRNTREWSMVDPYGTPDPPFGGRIIQLQERTYGGEKEFQCSLVDYGFDVSRTKVLGWPDGWITPGYSPVGYPGGYSARAWLAGRRSEGLPYDGLLVQRLGNFDFSGIAPLFDTIILTQELLPGNSGMGVTANNGIPGYFAFMMLGDVITAITDAALWHYNQTSGGDPPLVPDWWISVVPYQQTLIPSFNLANMADDQGAPDWVVATDADPAAGEIPAQHPWWHYRDAEHIQTTPVILGDGGDPTQPLDPVTGLHPLVWAVGYQADHADAYPKYYELPDGPEGSVPPGWTEAVILEPRLHTQALANRIVQNIQYVTWAPQGRIEMTVDAPVRRGDRVQYRDPNEGYDTVFTVQESAGVDGALNLQRRAITLGRRALTVIDKLKGGLPDVLLAKEDYAYQMGLLASRAVPGAQPVLPLGQTPSGPSNNVIEPPYKDTSGLDVRGGVYDRPVGATGTTDSPFPPNEKSLQVRPARVPGQPLPDAGTWVSRADGRPHPNSFHVGAFTADGTYPGTLAIYQIILTGIDLTGTGSVTILKNGVAVTGAISGDGHHALSPTITLDPSSGVGVRADVFSLTVSGTGTADPLYVVVWEA